MGRDHRNVCGLNYFKVYVEGDLCDLAVELDIL